MSRVGITVEGGLLAADLVERIAAGDTAIPGQQAKDFGVEAARLSAEIQAAFSDTRALPVSADIGEGGLDFSAEPRRFNAKILGLLAGDSGIARRDAFNEVGGEEAALDGDADPAHVAPPEGRSTKQPRMSGGSCGSTLRRGGFGQSA